MKSIQSEPGLKIYKLNSDLKRAQSLQHELLSGTVLLFKRVFQTQDARILRNLVMDWSREQPTLTFDKNANSQNLNFHRIDGSPEKSNLPHVFHQYGFGDIDAINNNLKLKLMEFVTPMLELQNLLAGTAYQIDDPNFRVKLLQYVCGGGFLAQHTHPLEPQRVGLICALSERGKDYDSGGTTFDTPSGKVDTGAFHSAGDIIAFRYDLPHEVLPTDPESAVDWTSTKGRWNLVLELLDTHTRSNYRP
ncbi:MAG: hypothetical protein ISP91_11620 [Pseudomonadales bacterium]|nr:hypothetical protein [Pseudomonadales bacterium]